MQHGSLSVAQQCSRPTLRMYKHRMGAHTSLRFHTPCDTVFTLQSVGCNSAVARALAPSIGRKSTVRERGSWSTLCSESARREASYPLQSVDACYSSSSSLPLSPCPRYRSLSLASPIWPNSAKSPRSPPAGTAKNKQRPDPKLCRSHEDSTSSGEPVRAEYIVYACSASRAALGRQFCFAARPPEIYLKLDREPGCVTAKSGFHDRVARPHD